MKSSAQICFLLVNLALLVASLPIELISTQQVFNVWSYEDYLKQLAAHQDETANDIEADDISQPWDHPVLPEERYEILVDESNTEHNEPAASPKVIPATAREEAEQASADAVLAFENNKPVTQEPVVAADERSSSVTNKPVLVAEDRLLFVKQEPVIFVTDNEGSGFTQDTLLEATNEGSGSADFEGSGSSSSSVLSDPVPVQTTATDDVSKPDLTQTVSLTSLPEGSELKDEFVAETTTSTDSELKETLTTLSEDALVLTTTEPAFTLTDDSLLSTTQNAIESSIDDSTDQTTIAAVEGQARSNASQDEASTEQDTTIVIDSTVQMTTEAGINEPTDLVTAEELLASTGSPTEETTSAF